MFHETPMKRRGPVHETPEVGYWDVKAAVWGADAAPTKENRRGNASCTSTDEMTRETDTI